MGGFITGGGEIGGSGALVPISLKNTVGNAIIDGPEITDEGSHYFSINPDTGFAILYKTISGLPQPASCEFGGETVLVGPRVGVAAFGHHIATEDTLPNHLHLHAHNVLSNGVTALDARIIDSYLYVADFPTQIDESGTITDTLFNFDFAPSAGVAFNSIKLKTGATAATGTIRMQVWQTTADTGPLVFDQYYPASQFPANTVVPMAAVGYIQLDKGITYPIRISSPTTFSFKTNAAVDFPYLLSDTSFIREDDMLQTVNYDWLVDDSHAFTVGEWVIESKRIWVCNTAGVQVGTFASNAALWDILGAGVHFWSRTGTTLSPATAGDAVQVGNLNINANTITSFSGNTNISSVAGNTIVSSANITTISSVNDVNITPGSSGKITLTTDNNDIVLNPVGPPGGQGIKLSQLTANSGLYTDSVQRMTNTAPTSGDLGHWNRTATTLSTATAGDDITTTGKLNIGISQIPPELASVKGSTGGTFIQVRDERSLSGDVAGIKFSTMPAGQPPQSAKSMIAHQETSTFGVGKLIFSLNPNGDATDVTKADVKFIMQPSGNFDILSGDLNNSSTRVNKGWLTDLDVSGSTKAFMTADSTVPLIADTSLSDTALVNTRFVNDVYKAGDVKNAVAAVATVNHPRTGHPTLHGYTTLTLDRVLLTGQTNAAENGSYIAASGSWARADDWDETLNARAGGQFTVANPGTTKNAYQYVCTTQGTIVINTTPTAWFEISPREMTSIDGTNILAVSNTTTSISKSLQYNIAMSEPSYVAGQSWYDSVSKGHVLDTGYTDVRLNAGRETHIEVYNATASQINNGDPVSVTGTVTGGIANVVPMDSSSVLLALGFAGVATMNIPAGTAGVVTNFGKVNDVNTGVLALGFIYADSAGGYTQTRPVYPEQRLLIGGVTKTGVTDGVLTIGAQIIPRRSASRSYTFTSSLAAAGTHYRAGFYDWSATSVVLTNASLSVTHGAANLTRAAHAGVVPLAAGTVDTGQVGLQVTGTLDSETGVQVASQTKIITDDITTLTGNLMAETVEKFSGTVTLALYTVSGAPTTYSLTMNYGYSSYEDFANINGTVTAFNAVWEAGANDSIFDISLKHHKSAGWTYAASGFVPGSTDICNRLTDQQINSDLTTGEEGKYKRISLDTFISGSGTEGVIIEIATGSTNTIRSMDMHITAFSEELD